MKIMLMTDLEGVAGVKEFDDWCQPGDTFYPIACRLLTLEVNAVIDGMFAGGASHVQVADGHGCGAIDVELLDPRVEYARGWAEGFPFGLDETYDGVGWVGQHAKASTENSHLAHTQGFHYIDLSVNDISIGEFGQLTMCTAELGVPAFFAAGELALTLEAQALVPGIVTCWVKRGTTPGTGVNCTHAEYRVRNRGAVHVAPQRAREVLRNAGERAVKRLHDMPPTLIDLQPPFERVTILRPEKEDYPKQIDRAEHPNSVIELMRMPMSPQPMS
jgi:D-amino peptidase